MVSRRCALELAGAGLFGLAGCVDGGGDPPSATPTDTTTAPRTPARPSPSRTPTPETDVEVEGASPAWARSLDGPIRTDPVYVDGHVAVVAGTTVHGLDAATGETAWTFDSPVAPEGDYGRPTATLRRHDGTIYALVGISVGTGAHDHVLHALAPTGELRWSYESGAGGFHDLVGFGGDAAVLATSDDAIGGGGMDDHVAIAVDLATGADRWRAKTGDGMGGSVGDGVAAVRLYGGVDCFDLATGDRRFQFVPDGDHDVEATAVGGGRVFAAVQRYEGDGPTLYALSSADGATDWTLDGRLVTSLRYRGDLYVGGETVLRLAPDGTERWRYDPGGLLSGVPFDADALYTNAGSRVVSVARVDGSERWAADATRLAIPRARGGDAVVSLDGQVHTVFAHAVADGSERWRATVYGEYPPTPAAGPDGAYLVSTGGDVAKVPL